MAANSETWELAVRLRGEGLESTEKDLEGIENRFDATADSVDASAQDMEGFARKWQGAMQAILIGLGVAAAGLLSQVPVVGEVMSGLEAIIEGVAFQIDGVLRPALGPVTEGFFGVADSVFSAEGALGAIIGVLGAVVAGVGMLGAVAVAVSAIFGVSMGVVLVVMGKVLLAIAAVVAVAAVLKQAWDQNLGGIQDTTRQFVDLVTRFWDRFGDDIMNATRGAFQVITNVVMSAADILLTALGIVVALLSGDWGRAWELAKGFAVRTMERLRSTVGLFGRFFLGVLDTIIDVFPGLVGDMFRAGRAVVMGLWDGIRDVWDQFKGWWEDKVGGVLSTVKDTLGGDGPSGFARELGELSGNAPEGFRVGVDQLRASVFGGGGRGGARRHAFAGRRSLETVVQIDGREVVRATTDKQKRGFDSRGRTP